MLKQDKRSVSQTTAENDFLLNYDLCLLYLLELYPQIGDSNKSGVMGVISPR